MNIHFTIDESSLGLVLTAASEKGIVAILLGDESQQLKLDLRERFPDATISEGDDATRELGHRVVEFIESPARQLDAPLDPQGTEFQQTVWRSLSEIPRGSTATYTQIADRIGRPKSVRAVGAACAANALAVVVPCHRVVRSDGSLSGYRWGVQRKRLLLEREASM